MTSKQALARGSIVQRNGSKREYVVFVLLRLYVVLINKMAAFAGMYCKLRGLTEGWLSRLCRTAQSVLCLALAFLNLLLGIYRDSRY